jgi:effector-binding domain-containing protein
MEIQIKDIESIKIAYIEGNGKVGELNQDIDKLYGELHKHNLQHFINGSAMGIFYTEAGGKYLAAVPVKDPLPRGSKLKYKLLPPINCMSVVHTGSVDAIEESFNKLKQYQLQHNLKWNFPVREIYVPKNRGEGFDIEIQVPLEAEIS